MLTVAQYKEKIALYMKKLGEINSRCGAENREMTDEERSLKKELMDKVDELQEIVATEERHDRLSRQLEGPANAPASRPAPGTQVVPPQDKRDRFKALGENIMAVVHAARQGGQVDPRLFRAAATGLGETVPSDGGFLVQSDFANELMQETFNTGVLYQRCRRIQLSANSNSIKINGVDETSRASTRDGGILGYWKDEASQKTSSKPKFRQIELNLKKLIGLCYATDELLADAVALESFIRSAFPREFGFLLDDAVVNGSGVGQPLGILNAGCLVSVSKESGQKAATILAENVIKMYSRMFASSLNNAVWLVNQNTLPQLYTMSLAVGTGGAPIFVPAGNIAGQPFNTLLGRPIIPIEQCASLGTVGDIIFADLNGYLLAEKGGIQADMSIHVQFIYDESVFRFVMRVDGQPLRASALTPYKGGASYTQSHFVALETRS